MEHWSNLAINIPVLSYKMWVLIVTSANILIFFFYPLSFSLCNARCLEHVVCPSSKRDLEDLCLRIVVHICFKHAALEQRWRACKCSQGPQSRTCVDFFERTMMKTYNRTWCLQGSHFRSLDSVPNLAKSLCHIISLHGKQKKINSKTACSGITHWHIPWQHKRILLLDTCYSILNSGIDTQDLQCLQPLYIKALLWNERCCVGCWKPRDNPLRFGNSG